MRELVQKLGYKLDLVDNIWINPNYKGIAYSDGDEVEKRIASIIKQALDVSVLSTELRQYCTDWPSLYHLSSTRANIMRPFKHILNTSDVLEIGAGCGAITRYIGECGANVLAIEGSPRRAAIARSRTRDLENVAVLTEKFDQFQCDHQFDVITLIGVLEYANLFTSGENPPLEMLKRVRSLLKPEGKLIIAIENQLGLKYFAGAPEDHLGQPMVGIEGRYRKDQPQTFGRKVLTGMLEQAGFGTSEFLAPFPDYKLPISILTEEGFSNKNFDAAAFAWQSARHDPQLPAYCNFSLELAWPEVFKNDLGLEIANSFLMIATPNVNRIIDTGVLAYHFSTDRIPAYCKETVFISSDVKDIRVEYRSLDTPHENADKENNSLIKFICPNSDDYALGRLLSLEFINIVTRDGWSFEQVAQFIRRYFLIIEMFAKSVGMQVNMASPYAELSGEFFDVVPQNIIIREDGSPSLIDKEWQLVKPIEVAHLLFRSLLLLLNSITRFGLLVSGVNLTRYQFIDGVFTAANLELQEEDYARYITLEAEIQQAVSGRSAENFLTWAKDQPLPILNLSQAVSERDGQIANLNQSVAERDEQITNPNQSVTEHDEQITNLNQSVAERDGQIARLNQVAAERENRLKQIKASTSWRITRPIRIIKSLRLTSTIASLCANKVFHISSNEDSTKHYPHWFNATFYLKNNPDVAQSGMDPYEHFRLYGEKEGRQPAADKLIVRNIKRAWLVRTALVVGYRRAGGVSPAIRKALTVLRRGGLDGVKQSLIFLHTQTINTPAGFDRNNYSEWLRRYDTITDEKRASMRTSMAKFPHIPLISVVMPTYNPNPAWLIEAIESVRSQIYPHWELCIADDASTDKAIHAILEGYAKEDARIKVAFREKNGHISAATNTAIELVNGTWMALLDHDDLLSEHALFWVAQQIVTNSEVGLIYSDEDKLDQSGRRYDPYFKPDWNPDLFLSHNMICHLSVYRIDLVKSVGGFRKDYEGAQDYDLALRCTEQLTPQQIVHISRVLYHWRSHPGSTALAGSEKNYALLAGERALNDHFDRAQITAKAALLNFGMYRAKYAISAPAPLVSLIIPTRNGLTLLKQCIESILVKTTYKNYEILIVNNNSDDPNTLAYFTSLAKYKRIRVIHDDRAFNFSALNNAAVKQARGEYIGLINNDIEVISPTWLHEMVSLAIQPGVGAVGARLWYPDDTLQHGGCITGIGGVAGHSHKHLSRGHFGYFARAQLIQTLSVVTAACLVVKKSIYQEVGGLDEVNLTVAFNDVDFCLRVREAGYRNIWTPYAELYHHESATRGHEDTPEKELRFENEALYMKTRWGNSLMHDPAYSPNLTLNHEDFSLAWPPRVNPI